MDILEIRKRARARRDWQQETAPPAVAPAAPAAPEVEPPAAALAPTPGATRTPAPVPAPAAAVAVVDAAPLPRAAATAALPEALERSAAEDQDAHLLAEFFASDRDAAINRFADPTLFSGARGFTRASPDSVRYLVCRVGDEEYGVELSYTREILKPLPRTLVPRAPAEVLGVISLRGRVLPVVDLSQRLGAVAGPGGQRGERYVVLQVLGEILCVRVDAVSGVVGFSPAEIEPAPTTLRSVGGDAVAGIGRSEQRMIILLRIDELVGALLREQGEAR